MKNNSNNKETENESSTKNENSIQNNATAYHTPKLLRYGGLAELVKRTPGRAKDGETINLDCTLT